MFLSDKISLLLILYTSLSFGVIRLGRTVSLCGTVQAESTSIKNGIDFWANYINSRGGITDINGTAHLVELITWNDASDSELVTRLYEDIINRDRVNALFGPMSTDLTARAVDVANRSGSIPIVFSGASSPSIYDKKYPNAFGLLARTPLRSRPCMDFFSVSGAKTIVTGYGNESFQASVISGIKAQAIELGMGVINEQVWDLSKTDWSDSISQWRQLNPDLLIIGLRGTAATLLTYQLRGSGWSPRAIYYTSGTALAVVEDQLGWESYYGFAGDQWSPMLKFADPVFGSVDNFTQLFQTTYGYVPTLYDVSSVAAGLVIQRAFETTRSFSPDDLNAALRNVSFDTTIWGPISFLETGELATSIVICQQILSINGTYITSIIEPSTYRDRLGIYPGIPSNPIGSSRRKLIIGLSIGLGLGVILIIILLIIIIWFRRNYVTIVLSKDESNLSNWNT